MELKPALKTKDPKTISKRKNNSGTFNKDNPSKMKKNSKPREEKNSTNDSFDFENQSPKMGKKRPADHDREVTEVKKARISAKNKSFKDPKLKSKTFQSKKFSPKGSKNGKSEPEKPNWNDFKKEKKALRDKRRASEYEGDTYDVSVKAKKRLESIRCKDCPKDGQVKELAVLHSMLKGKLLSVVYAHDMSRVIQTMLKLAHTHKQTNTLKSMINELIEDIAGMAKKKYAIHVVKTIIDVAPNAERIAIVKAFQGKVMKLLAHSIAGSAIKQLLSKLKPNERHSLQKELYGGSSKLINSETAVSLEIIFKVLPHMKDQTLMNTKENLTTLFEKNAVDSSMVHAVLLDYLSYSTAEEVSSMLDIARDHFKALTNSKDGVLVAMMCVWMGTPKARKKMIKELKGEVLNLACGEHTHLLLLAIFDSVDDTKLIEKIIIPELILGEDSISKLLGNTYGRKVLSYLCSRRDPRLFSAPVVAVLAQGDNNPYSKKDLEARTSELQSMVVPSLLSHIAENTPQWVDNHPNLVVLLIVLKCGSGEQLKAALLSIAKHVVSPSECKSKDVDLSRADEIGCHSILKKIAQHDEVFAKKGLATFGAALLGELTDKHTLIWLTNNRCCYLLLMVLQHGAADVVEELKTKIKKLSPKAWASSESVPIGGQKLQEMLNLK